MTGVEVTTVMGVTTGAEDLTETVGGIRKKDASRHHHYGIEMLNSDGITEAVK